MHFVVQASLAALASVGLIVSADAQTRGAAAAAGPTVTPERAALLSAQPTAIGMVQTPDGWIKTCPDPAQPNACAIAGAFALAPSTAPNLRVTLGTAAVKGIRPLAVTLPIDVALRPGFTIVLENGEAILGEYTTCGAVGCSGEVGVSDATYQRLLRGKRLGILIGNARDMVLRLDVPLDTFGSTAMGHPTSMAEIALRREIVAAQLRGAGENGSPARTP